MMISNEQSNPMLRVVIVLIMAMIGECIRFEHGKVKVHDENEPIYFKDNLNDPSLNYYYGNESEAAYLEKVFKFGSLHNTTPCDIRIPYVNVTDHLSCFRCDPITPTTNFLKDKVLFNLDSRSCEICNNHSTTICTQGLQGNTESTTSKNQATTSPLPPQNSNQNNSSSNLPSNNPTSEKTSSPTLPSNATSSTPIQNTTINNSNLTTENKCPSTRPFYDKDTKLCDSCKTGSQYVQASQTCETIQTTPPVKNSSAPTTENAKNESTATSKETIKQSTVNTTNNEQQIQSTNASRQQNGSGAIQSSQSKVSSSNSSTNTNQSGSITNNASTLTLNSSTANGSIAASNGTNLSSSSECPSTRPLYDPTTKLCNSCSQGDQYLPSTQKCQKIIYMISPQTKRIILPNSTYLTTYNQALKKNNPTRTLQYCPTDSPFYSGQRCIQCHPDQYFNITSGSCGAGCESGLVYDQQLQICIQGYYATNVNASNIVSVLTNYSDWKNSTEKLSSGSERVITCPIDKPFAINGTCVYCSINLPLFNLDTNLCDQCSQGRYYVPEDRICKPSFSSTTSVQRMVMNII